MTLWVEDFVAWAKNNGGIKTLSLACADRDLPSDGRKYETYTRILEEWNEELRLSEVFKDDAEGYEPPESLTPERFGEVLSEYHAEGEDPPRLEEYTNRREAEYHLIRAQVATIKQTLLGIDAEESNEDSSDSSEDRKRKKKKKAKGKGEKKLKKKKAAKKTINTWEPVSRSHERGVNSGWLSEDVGVQRDYFAWKIAGEEPIPLPFSALALIGRKLLVVQDLGREDLEWPGLAEERQPIITAVGVAGVTLSDRPYEDHDTLYLNPLDPGLQIFCLSSPYTSGDLRPDRWRNLQRVPSWEEAARVYRADPDQSKCFLLEETADGIRASFCLDDSATWAGDARTMEGVSVLPRSMSDTYPATGLMKLLAQGAMGMEEKTRKAEACATLLHLSANAAINMTAESKGKRHPLPTVPREMAGIHTSPLDSTSIPSSMPWYLRLEMATEVGSPDLSDTQEFECEKHWICLGCSAMPICKASPDITPAEAEGGLWRISDEAKAAIVVLKPGKIICSSCKLMGHPPLNSMVPCPGEMCQEWIVTPKDYFLAGCGECDVAFGVMHDVDVKLDTSKAKKLEKKEEELAMRIYQYLRFTGGHSSLENWGRSLGDPVDMLLRLNELRARPSEHSEPLPLKITERIMAALMFCDFSPNGLCLFDGGEECDEELPLLSADELKNVMKKYSQGKLPRPKDPTTHLKDSQRVREYLRMYRRLLDMMVLITGSNRESDPETAEQVVKHEVLHVARKNRWPAKVVRKLLDCLLESTRNRLVRKMQMPQSSQLFGFEKKHGKCIRFVPHLGCREIVEDIQMKMEEITIHSALKQVDFELPLEPKEGARKQTPGEAQADKKKKPSREERAAILVADKAKAVEQAAQGARDQAAAKVKKLEDENKRPKSEVQKAAKKGGGGTTQI